MLLCLLGGVHVCMCVRACVRSGPQTGSANMNDILLAGPHGVNTSFYPGLCLHVLLCPWTFSWHYKVS